MRQVHPVGNSRTVYCFHIQPSDKGQEIGKADDPSKANHLGSDRARLCQIQNERWVPVSE
jgi:hypothetical protein